MRTCTCTCMSQDRYTGFAVACCLDAVFNIGAFMFLFGPRKCAHAKPMHVHAHEHVPVYDTHLRDQET